MTDTELSQKRQVARDVLITYGIDPDSVIPSIGFSSVSEIAQAQQEKRIGLGANYHTGTWNYLANAPEKRIDWWLAVVPWLLAGISIILAIAQGRKLYALVAFGILIVNSMSKRFAEVGNAIGGISIMGAAIVAFNGHWDWAGIIVAFAIAAFCGRARIMWYSEIIVARALLNDSIFAMLFVTEKVNMRENSTGKRIYYKRD
jgi:hypothetical protein